MTGIQIYLLGIFLLLASQGCISPINMAYDSAVPLAAKQVSVTAAYNISDESNVQVEEFDRTDSYMFRFGMGINEKTSLHAGYYHKSSRFEQFFFANTADYAFEAYDYFELGPKFTITKNNDLAIKTLIGAYIYENEVVAYALYGSFIYTYSHPNSKFEISCITHGTGILEKSGYQLVPGLNIGAGFSSNLKVWALRPEIGVNTRSFTAGIGLELRIGRKVTRIK